MNDPQPDPMFNPKFVEFLSELLAAGIDLTLRLVSKPDGTKELRAVFQDGFYKSNGQAYLVFEANAVWLRTRYGGEKVVLNLEDVVYESFHWKDQAGAPSDFVPWSMLYQQFGLNN